MKDFYPAAIAALITLVCHTQPVLAKSPPVIEYTKIWTDDYHNYNKVVYPAYTKALKDETGDEVTIEVWHGLATGFHKNGKKAWEVEYRDGKREGDFTSWADN